MEIGQKDKDLKVVLEKIGKDYQVIKKLGCGAYSKVYLVQHGILEDKRALKIMNAGSILRELKRQPGKIKEKYHEITGRFINEAKIYAKIKHPNIVKIHDVNFAEDKDRQIKIPYMIIHYIDGKVLHDQLKHNLPLEMPLIYLVAESILPALAAIHKAKIIHRDIKPNNIMIDYNNNKAILIDFGLAKDLIHGKDMTTLGTFLGNPRYTAPEQMEFQRKSIPRPKPTLDIFSFGVVLFRMLTGKFPYKQRSIMDFVKRKITVPNVRKLNPKLPQGIEQVIFKAVAWEPSQRYQSAEKFLTALQEIKEKTGKKTQAKTALEDRVKKSKNTFVRSPIFKVILIILLLIALLITAFILLNPSKTGKNQDETSAVKNFTPGVQVSLLNNVRQGKNFPPNFQSYPGKKIDLNIS